MFNPLPLTVNWLFGFTVRACAVAIVSPISVVSVTGASTVTGVATRRLALPPVVTTRITPALTPVGTVSVTSCWSSTLLGNPIVSLSRMLRTSFVVTACPSIVMVRPASSRPVPSSTNCWPGVSVPLTLRSVGTICNTTPEPSRCRRTVPVVAATGTTTVRLDPSAATLAAATVISSKLPLVSSVVKDTISLATKPLPCSVMVWPETGSV